MDTFPETCVCVYVHICVCIYMVKHIYMDNGHMRDSVLLIIRDTPITTKVRSCFTPARVDIALNIPLATIWAMETVMNQQKVKMARPLCEQHGSCLKHFRDSSSDLAIPLLALSPVALQVEIRTSLYASVDSTRPQNKSKRNCEEYGSCGRLFA